MQYERLKLACKQKGTSVTALAISLGMSRSNVTHWKNGQNPSTEVLLRMAEALGTSVDYLLGNDAKKDATENVGDAKSSVQDEIAELMDLLSQSGQENAVWYVRSLVERENGGAR